MCFKVLNMYDFELYILFNKSCYQILFLNSVTIDMWDVYNTGFDIYTSMV